MLTYADVCVISGLALEMHRQNVQLKQVMEKFKQKFTKLEVKLYKVDEEQGTRTPHDQPPNKEEHSGTFGKILWSLKKRSLNRAFIEPS